MSKRTIVLLLLAVLLPAGSLGVVGLVLVGQQREVLRLREQDRSLLLARVAGDSLVARLDRTAQEVVELQPISSHEKYPGGKDILFLGRLVSDRWEPPYESLITSPISQPRFQRRLRQLRQAEVAGRGTDGLLRDYAAALRAATDSSQVAYLKLQQARVLLAGEREPEATRILLPLARADVRIADEFGIPLAFYAMELLGPDAPEFESDTWLNPTAHAYLQDIDRLASDEEHALLRFASAAASGITGWVAAPGADWLIGRREDLVLGIRVSALAELLTDLEGVASVASRDSSDQITLAPNFPALALRMTSTPESASMTPWIVGLGLILLLSGMGGFLLLRDYRREKILAKLRAEFVSSVSHEVRTPLAAIRLYTESLLKYGPDGEESWRSDLTTIADETNRLTRMLDNVLRASRIERGAADYRLTYDRVDAVVHRAVKAMIPSLDEAGCSVVVVAEEVDAVIDRDAIEQAVVNLLSNAAKYAPGSEVRVGCAITEAQVVISVEDDGPGIDPVECSHIFESFYRGSAVDQTGTGLGLAVVQHVARGHGGEATVTSSLGRGSSFSFQIPRSS